MRSELLDTATREVRNNVHAKLYAAMTDRSADDESGGELERIEDAVMEAITDPSIGWALAFISGVTMSPDLQRLVMPSEHKHTPLPRREYHGGG